MVDSCFQDTVVAAAADCMCSGQDIGCVVGAAVAGSWSQKV